METGRMAAARMVAATDSPADMARVRDTATTIAVMTTVRHVTPAATNGVTNAATIINSGSAMGAGELFRRSKYHDR